MNAIMNRRRYSALSYDKALDLAPRVTDPVFVLLSEPFRTLLTKQRFSSKTDYHALCVTMDHASLMQVP